MIHCNMPTWRYRGWTRELYWWWNDQWQYMRWDRLTNTWCVDCGWHDYNVTNRKGERKASLDFCWPLGSALLIAKLSENLDQEKYRESMYANPGIGSKEGQQKVNQTNLSFLPSTTSLAEWGRTTGYPIWNSSKTGSVHSSRGVGETV